MRHLKNGIAEKNFIIILRLLRFSLSYL